MRPTRRAWVATAAAAGASAGLAALGQPGPAVALATASLGTGLLVTERGTQADRPGDACLGPLRAVAGIAKALGLEGAAVMVPPGGALREARCFVPARAAKPEELPPLDPATVVHRAPPGVLGLALPPMGLGLLQAWERQNGLPRGQGTEEAVLHLKLALPGLEVGKGVAAERRGNQVRVRFVHTLLGEACAWTRAEGAPWHVQGMCPTCSLAHALVALAAARPVQVVEAEGDAQAMRLTLEVASSSPA